MKVWEALLRGEGSGRAGGEERRQPAGSYGSETALPGSQMGEQVLHLASSSSVEQSCHRALKGGIGAAAEPISGHSFALFFHSSISVNCLAQSSLVLCSQPWGAWCLAPSGDCLGK